MHREGAQRDDDGSVSGGVVAGWVRWVGGGAAGVRGFAVVDGSGFRGAGGGVDGAAGVAGAVGVFVGVAV